MSVLKALTSPPYRMKVLMSVKLQADPSFVVAIFGSSELKRDIERRTERDSDLQQATFRTSLLFALLFRFSFSCFMLTSTYSSAHFSHAFCPFSHLPISFPPLLLGRVQIT
ncbi:hypothetical protein H0G86_002674 [Trichoderma simmonsii]|uniref:Uncharacterized protein n=1 Tax=Trichoderma simmonsii TaxID=1491479 RepID=A0A8G0L738_9HYPO|nr:hypothetical protein H0G86_002674 [Trichoderma simmonsii]